MYDGFIINMNDDIKFMKEALKEANKAFLNDEVPIGAVIVKDNKIISRAYNLKESKKDPTAHAEILAIKKACKKLQNWRLNDTVMYVTLEPCAMCASAISQARISKVVFASEDNKNGAILNGPKIYNSKTINNAPIVIKNVCEKEAKDLLQKFFKNKRK